MKRSKKMPEKKKRLKPKMNGQQLCITRNRSRFSDPGYIEKSRGG
jgi:hypothetical protein